jgi:hypothetical protein
MFSMGQLFEIEGDFDLMYRDNLDNLYLVDDYTIKKYDSKGELMFVYSDNYLGKISSLSIGEGLKLLVYYRNNAQLVVLDNSLSQLSTAVSLNFYNLGTTTLLCSSVQNRYWLYNPLDGAIVRTTNTISPVFNSGNLDQLLNYEIDPNYMVEWGNTLYLNDPKEGILVFDIFGTYQKTIPLKELEDFQVTENGIFFMEKDSFNYYDFLSFQIQKVELPEEGSKKVLISNKLLFLHFDSKVKVYIRNTF